MSRRFALISLMALVALALLGCEGKDRNANNGLSKCPDLPSPPPSGATDERDPVASLEAVSCGELNLWGSAMPKSLNMWQDYNSFSVSIMGLMFEPLATLHSTRDEAIGVLASDWSISPDGKTYTFQIDPRAHWSDGTPITAYDVQFYYDVIMDPKNLTPIFKVGLSRFSRPVVSDSMTLSITAKEAHWGNFWEAAGLMAFPRQAWQGKNFNEVRFEFPVVSGPYRIKELRKDRFLEMERRADWWGFQKNWNHGKYNFQILRYRFVEDQIKALEAFKKQDFDAYPIYTSAIWMKQTDFDAVSRNWAVKQRIFNQEPIGFQGMAFNLRRPKFQDVRVRKALSLLIDRKLMNEKFMYNQYFLLNSYYPDLWPDNKNPTAPMYPFAPDSARKLLAEAGYKPGQQGQLIGKDGQPLTISFLTATTDMRHLTRYQEDLKAVGIDARIEPLSQSTLRQRIDEGDFDMWWVSWGAGRLRDPEASWYSRTADDKGTNNVAGLKDRVVDSLIDLQKTEMDLGKRNQILRALDNRLVELVPYVLLWQADHHRLLYWNRFGMPVGVYDRFNREEAIPVYWWFDAKKDQLLRKAMSDNKALPASPADVRYTEGTSGK